MEDKYREVVKHTFPIVCYNNTLDNPWLHFSEFAIKNGRFLRT